MVGPGRELPVGNILRGFGDGADPIERGVGLIPSGGTDPLPINTPAGP